MSTDPRIQEHIQDSVNALLDGSASGDLMFFAGVQQESIPTALFLDPTLRPVDRNLWVVMRLGMRAGGQRAAFPSYEDLENVWRVGSRDTLSISYALLRLQGWLTRVHAVRDAQGRHRGQIWMMHDEPAPLAEIIEIDPDYMSFSMSAAGTVARESGGGGRDGRFPVRGHRARRGHHRPYRGLSPAPRLPVCPSWQ